eukprot:jgi/Hompol1/892/HPOL_005451-RA
MNNVPDVFFTHLRQHMFPSSESYLRRELPSSPLAINAINAFIAGCATVPDPETSLRTATYLSAAISNIGLALKSPSPASVLGFLLLSLSSTNTSTLSETSQYMHLAQRMAITLKINTEEGVMALAQSKEDQDAIRCVWWAIVQLDTIMMCAAGIVTSFSYSTSQVRLPTDVNTLPAHPFDQADAVEIAIMSSTAWHIPPLPGRGIMANLFIIEKIMGRIATFCNTVRDGGFRSFAEMAEARAHLDASLDAWFHAAPKSITECTAHLSMTHSPAQTVPTWRPLFIMAIYHYSRIILWRIALAENITKSPSLAVSSHAFTTSIQAARAIANDVAMLIVKYDTAAQLNPFTCSQLYCASVILITSLKLPTPLSETTQNAAALAKLTDALRCFQKHWNMGEFELQILDQLSSFTDAKVIAEMFTSLFYPKLLRQQLKPIMLGSRLQFQLPSTPTPSPPGVVLETIESLSSATPSDHLGVSNIPSVQSTSSYQPFGSLAHQNIYESLSSTADIDIPMQAETSPIDMQEFSRFLQSPGFDSPQPQSQPFHMHSTVQ